MSRIGFGTSGVRGLVADLVPGVVAAYTRAFAGWLADTALAAEPATVLVGHDLRPSSPDIAAGVVAALHECGFAVSYAGALPTPALAFHALRNGWPAVVVTGSHIPFDRNGIKFYRPDGEILKEDEADIVARQGIEYLYLPVDFAAPTVSDYERFLELMEAVGERKVLIHCAANWRVSAFYSRYAIDRGIWSPQEADRFMLSIWQPQEHPPWPQWLEEISCRS